MTGDRTIVGVPEGGPLVRIDVFLHRQFPLLSRAAIQRAIAAGLVTVGTRPAKPSQRLRGGETISVRWPESVPAQALPEAIPLEIVFEDEHLLVLNKPLGLVVHPSAGHAEHTLVNALLHHCRGQLSGIGGVERPGIVHRLDKDTSGCLVVAKNDAAHLSLAQQFADRSVEKVYSAIACGALRPDAGEISAAIARHPTHRKRMAVTNGKGRAALTTYRVLERFGLATFVEARLHTGRTHQIRVHFHHLGAPLVGDQTYGKRQTQKLEDELGISLPRQMLHARLLAFVHPVENRTMLFEAKLPEDFRAVLEVLRRARSAAS